jgi:hypothetical protein
MRIASFLVLIVSLFFTKSTLGQDVLQPVQKGWDRIYIKDVGYFDLPQTVEIPKGVYKEFVDGFREIKGYDTPQFVAQQKGLNDFNIDGFEKYSRVMLATDIGSPDDFINSDFDLTLFTTEDFTTLEKATDEAYKEQVVKSIELAENGVKIIEWYPLKIEKINGFLCFHVSYTRQFLDRPLVLVNMYAFHNYDRMHTLTLSYRLSEANYWKTDFEKVLDSFRITNLK